MPYLMSVSSAMYYDNNEELVFYTVCNANGRGCGWEDGESYSDVADCTVSDCPDCGSDDVKDVAEWV